MSCTLTHQLWVVRWANWNISQKWKVKILMDALNFLTHIFSEKSDKDEISFTNVKYSKNGWIALAFFPIDFFRMKCRFLCGNTTQKTSKSLLRPCQRTCRGFLSGAKNSWWIHLPIHLSTDFFEETSVITAPLTTPITSASGCRFFFRKLYSRDLTDKLRPYQRVSSLDKVDKLFLNKG